LDTAIGNSQEPGTDCTMMLDSLTPDARSLALVPASRGSIIAMGRGSVQGSAGGGVGFGRRTGIPACVDDANAEAAAIMLLGFSGAFE